MFPHNRGFVVCRKNTGENDRWKRTFQLSDTTYVYTSSYIPVLLWNSCWWVARPPHKPPQQQPTRTRVPTPHLCRRPTHTQHVRNNRGRNATSLTQTCDRTLLRRRHAVPSHKQLAALLAFGFCTLTSTFRTFVVARTRASDLWVTTCRRPNHRDVQTSCTVLHTQAKPLKALHHPRFLHRHRLLEWTAKEGRARDKDGLQPERRPHHSMMHRHSSLTSILQR
jgi:hypothetical protein